MNYHDAIVVGAGLFGSIIAEELRFQGRQVLVIDDFRPGAGSKPAACLMKPGWFAGLGKEVHEPSLDLLDRLYRVHDLRFKVGPGHATVHWCDPNTILEPGADLEGKVTAVTPGEKGWWMVQSVDSEGQANSPQFTELVVVAAGVWSMQLAPISTDLKSQAGMAFLWPGEFQPEPFIRPWAPYKQLVSFNRGDGMWVGDGSAIKEANWTEDREEQSYNRCAGAAGRLGRGDRERGLCKPLFGLRPYAKVKPCVLEEIRPGFWCATGGAKNGTIAAGWCAHEIGRKTS